MIVRVVILSVVLAGATDACLSSGSLTGFGGLGSLSNPLSPSCGCPGCSCSSYPASPQVSYSHYAKPAVIHQNFVPPPPPPAPYLPPYSSSFGGQYVQPTLIGTESQAVFGQQRNPSAYPAQPVSHQGSQALFQHTIITPASQYALPSMVYHTAPETIAVAEPQLTETVQDQVNEAPKAVAPPSEDVQQTETNVVRTEDVPSEPRQTAEDSVAVFPTAASTTTEQPVHLKAEVVPNRPEQQIQVASSKKTMEADAYLEVKKEPAEERRMSFVTYYNQECSGQIIEHSHAETIQTATIKCAQLGCQSANLKPNIKGNYQVDFLTNVEARLNKGGSYCLSLNTVPLRKRSAKRSHAGVVSFKVGSRRIPPNNVYSRFLPRSKN